MGLHEIARNIPKEFRDSILNENVIYKAIANATDRHMLILFTIWKEYIEPNGEADLGCPYCLNNMLSNFKALAPVLVDMRKNEQILEEL